jgi:hypothetical protein
MQALSLRQRIEMRINRVPKKSWKMTMGELLAQSEGCDAIEAPAVRKLVEDVQKLRFVVVPPINHNVSLTLCVAIPSKNKTKTAC